MHAHTHSEIHKGTVGAGKGLGPTLVVLCSMAKRKKNDWARYGHQLRAHGPGRGDRHGIRTHPYHALLFLKKTQDRVYSYPSRAHEHVRAHTQSEIHMAIVGAGKRSGPTPVVLCSIK